MKFLQILQLSEADSEFNMGISSGPSLVTNGLICFLDPFSTKNSSCFATNFFQNSSFSNATGMPQESGSNATNEVILFPNPGDSSYVLRQSAGTPYTEYQINLTNQLVSSTTYTMSGWYSESADYSCADGSRMFHARAFSSSGNHIATGIGIGTTIRSVNINGINWRYVYENINTPSDYSNDFNWYVGYGGSNYTGYRYYTNLKMERGTFPSLYDQSGLGNHHRFEGSASFNASNGRFTFDGATSKLTLPNSMAGATTTCTVQYFYSTSDTQELWARGNQNNSIYLSASYGNNYYHAGCGAPSNFVNLISTVNPATPINYRNGNYQMWEAKSVDFSGWTYFEWSGYPSGWELSGSVGAILVYNRNLSADESAQNFYALRSRFGI